MSQVVARLQAQLQQQQKELEAAAEAVRGAQQQAMRADELSTECKVSGALWGPYTLHCQLEDIQQSLVLSTVSADECCSNINMHC